MATLTLDLIRKKAEHHSDLLSSLEELSLHQLNLCSLTPILASCCPNLRILYLHNNLLSSPSVFKHIARLHSLQYLNLTLNNVTSLPPLTSALSSLTKLDLTLNHIALSALSSSLSSLSANDRLRELYLTGNPCSSWPWCRLYVIARLPALQSLDGVEVRRGERLDADYKMPEMQRDLDAAVAKEEQDRAGEEKQSEARHTAEDGQQEEEKQRGSSNKFTPELRLRMYEEQQAAEATRAAEAAASAPPPAPNLYESAMKSLSTLLDPTQYTSSLPSQRNTGRYEFSLTSPASSPQLLVLSVSVPRHLDTSLLTVDVHPRWLQVAVKGKLLVLHCEEEVEASSAVVQRVQSDGRLIVKMRKVSWSRQQAEPAEDGTAEAQTVMEFVSKKGREREAKEEEKRWEKKQHAVTAVNSGGSQLVDGMRQVQVRRSLTLEAKLQEDRDRTRGVRQTVGPHSSTAGDDDNDVPPLI